MLILIIRSRTGVCEINTPFTRALAMQSCSRNCSPAPDLVFFKFIIPRVSSGGVLFHRHLHVRAPRCFVSASRASHPHLACEAACPKRGWTTCPPRHRLLSPLSRAESLAPPLPAVLPSLRPGAGRGRPAHVAGPAGRLVGAGFERGPG